MTPRELEDIKASDLMSTKPITATPDEHLSEVIGRMRKEDVHEVLVAEKNSLLGIVSYDSLIKRRGLPPTTRVSHVLEHVPHIEDDCPLPVIAETMLSTGLRAIPVKKGDRLVGVVSRTDLINTVLEFPEMKEIRVGDIMTPSVQCVYETDAISVARHRMQELEARSIPVMNHYGDIVGMVGLKNIGPLVVQTLKRGEDAGLESGPVDVEVKSIMDSPPITVTRESTIADVIELMKKHDISNIIVAEKGAPLGVVTQIDLVELLIGFGKGDQIHVQITGLEEGPEVYEEMYDAIGKTVKRINKITTPKVLNMHIVKHHSRGDRFKHSIRARLTTENGMYYAKGFDWDLFVTLDEILDQLERDVKKEKDRRLDARKRKKRS